MPGIDLCSMGSMGSMGSQHAAMTIIVILLLIVATMILLLLLIIMIIIIQLNNNNDNNINQHDINHNHIVSNHDDCKCIPDPPSLFFRKVTDGVSTNGVTANSTFLDRGTFWALPLTYFYLPKSAWAYLFPQSIKIHHFCSGPVSADPICPQPSFCWPLSPFPCGRFP